MTPVRAALTAAWRRAAEPTDGLGGLGQGEREPIDRVDPLPPDVEACALQHRDDVRRPVLVGALRPDRLARLHHECQVGAVEGDLLPAAAAQVQLDARGLLVPDRAVADPVENEVPLEPLVDAGYAD